MVVVTQSGSLGFVLIHCCEMLQQLTLHPRRSLSAVNIMATLKKQNDSPASEEEDDRLS